MTRNERHVVKNPQSGWDIKKPHSRRMSGHARTKAEAVMRAREICRKEGAECVIHGEDGRFIAYDSFGRCLPAPEKKGAFQELISWLSWLFHSLPRH